MAATATVSAEIDLKLKEEAAAIFAEAGYTLADAFRSMLVQTVADHAFPLKLFTPNAATIEAMEAARRGDVLPVGSIDDLMADLHADD